MIGYIYYHATVQVEKELDILKAGARNVYQTFHNNNNFIEKLMFPLTPMMDRYFYVIRKINLLSYLSV